MIERNRPDTRWITCLWSSSFNPSGDLKTIFSRKSEVFCFSQLLVTYCHTVARASTVAATASQIKAANRWNIRQVWVNLRHLFLVAEAQHSVVCGQFVSTLALVEFRTRDVIELKLFLWLIFSSKMDKTQRAALISSVRKKVSWIETSPTSSLAPVAFSLYGGPE